MSSFLEELQAMSEARKRQVLVISTVIIMAIVVGVWLAYFNSIVTGGAAPTSANAVPAGQSIWTHVKNFFAHVFGSIGNMFNGTSHYSIQPQQ